MKVNATLNGKEVTPEQIERYWSFDWPYRYFKWPIKFPYRFKEFQIGALQNYNKWTVKNAPVYYLNQIIWLDENEYSEWINSLSLFNHEYGMEMLDLRHAEEDKNE